MYTGAIKLSDYGRFCFVARAVIMLLMVFVTSLLVSAPANANTEIINQNDIKLVVTGSDRAIIIFNQKRLVLKVGEENQSGVRLISANSERAIVDIDGEEVVIESNTASAFVLDEPESNNSNPSAKVVTVWADAQGFFFVNGRINSRSVRFLIDTGATTVTFSSVQADRFGIDYKNGQRGYASTASGVTPTVAIRLKEIDVGGITLRNIPANVIQGQFPEVPLLGGSFLNKVNMVRIGQKMELKKQ